MLITGVVLMVCGLILILKSFSSFQSRDKRYNKGTKLKRNNKAILFMFLGISLIILSIKFIMI